MILSADIEEVNFADPVLPVFKLDFFQCMVDQRLLAAFGRFINCCASVFFDCRIEFIALCVPGNKIRTGYNGVVNEW